jgi:PAS domain S-box-containing protein
VTAGEPPRAVTVALLTPSGADASLAARVLGAHGIVTRAARTMPELCEAIGEGVGAVLVAEEGLERTAREQLMEVLAAQPPWSDVPIVLLTHEGALSGPMNPGLQEVVRHGSVTLLERPVRVATLTTALDAALRARARQYEVRDAIAERERAAGEAVASEARLRAAVESAPYPLMVHADDGEIVFLSRTWCELTGYECDELRTLEDWFRLAYDETDAPRKVVQDDLDSPRPDGVSAPVWEHAVRVRGGGMRQWSFHAAKLGAAPDGRRLRIVAAIDVTDMRTLISRERALRAEAEAANMAKMQFLATMSHELRTPLNAIGGYAQLLEMGVRGPVSPQQAEDLARIQQSQQHLLGLINSVLNFTKLEAGNVQFAFEPVAVRDTVAAVETLVAPQMAAKGLRFTTSGTDADLVARGDEQKVRQVLVNLLTNALKYTERGTVRVECRASADGERVEILVHDSGIGIAPEHVARIFDPFVQVGRGLSAPGDGVGLGLAISRDLARAMGGELTAESTLGQGSTFMLALPRIMATRSMGKSLD